jgi:hypothetical protein
MQTRQQVYAEIDKEREYQRNKWGDKPQSLAGYLLILQKEVNEAIDGWMKNSDGRDAPLNEVLQVAAVAVACMEQYGCDGITFNTLDLLPPTDVSEATTKVTYTGDLPIVDHF